MFSYIAIMSVGFLVGLPPSSRLNIDEPYD